MPEFTIEELRRSKGMIGQIMPVIKDQNGNILDGFHRKRIDPFWKEVVVNVENSLQALLIRVHANMMRREIEAEEKVQWINEARALLKEQGKLGTQEEIAALLGLSQQWVAKYDAEPTQPHKNGKLPQRSNFFGYNVWGFKDESWRNLVISGDPNQPDKEFYHGSTPSFVIHQLISMFQPKSVLDSMAGVGTTGYVCRQHGIECDQFDLYPYEKYGVKQGDAEKVDTGKHYDLIFNHIPYFGMVKYGTDENDLSAMVYTHFFSKLHAIIARNFQLLNANGIYAILVGDWRTGGQLIPITAKATMIAVECGFILQDEAIKLTSEQKGLAIQEYRASKFGYMAQTFDTVLIFRKVQGE